MRSICIISLVLLIFSLGCGSNKKEKEQIQPRNKENLLEGLQPINKNWGVPTNLMAGDIPVYDENRNQITRDEMRQKAHTGKFTSIPYVNEDNEVVLWLVRPLTEAELRIQRDAEEKRNLKVDLKGKKASPFDVKDLEGNHYVLEDLKG